MWKIFNLWRKAATKNQVTHEKYLPYGDKDNFPLVWSSTIQHSPSASSCLSTVQDFLEGFGFSDTDLEKRIMNSKGETFFEIHQKTVRSFSEFEGFYWLFRYDANGKITEWEALPFESCRLGKPDSNGYITHIFYNPWFGTVEYRSVDKDQTKIYDVYSPAAVRDQIEEQGSKYKGQIMFFGTTSATSPYYPLPEAHVAHKWMKIEAGIADYHEDNINNGFLQPFMLALFGNPNEPSSNPEYTDYHGKGLPATVAEEFDDIIAENFMGAKRVGNMWVNWYNNRDEKPEVITMPANNNVDLFVNLCNQAIKVITISWRVPAILANINEGVSLGGDGNTIRVAVKLMQHRVVKKQRILTDAYQRIGKQLQTPITDPIVIVPYNPYPELEIIDDKIWNEMSPEERRKWIQENTEIELQQEVIQETTPQLVPAAQISNAIPIRFPEKVIQNAKKTKDYIQKMGLKCSGKWGNEIADKIINNTQLGMGEMRRINNFLKKNARNADRQFVDGCDVVQYHQLGGREMQEFLDKELERLKAWLN